MGGQGFFLSGRVLSGQKEQRPRWKRVLDSQGRAMGMVLGRQFVQEYFPPAEKQRYSDLVESVRTAYRERIDRLEWMSAATKARAKEKLATVIAKVGYPDKWKDYSALVVNTNSWCENMMSASRWRFNDMISKFGKPVDRKEWEMTPQTYNAYYNAANNEIVLPAAIFTVPGVRDEDLDDGFVYGYSAASTIGHEITHGFDDEGRQFDAQGNLKNWWTAEDAARFQKRAAVLAAQFDAYEPLPGRTSTAAPVSAKIWRITGEFCWDWTPSRKRSSTNRAQKSRATRPSSAISSATPMRGCFRTVRKICAASS